LSGLVRLSGLSNLVPRIGLFDQLSKDSSPKLELAGIEAGARNSLPLRNRLAPEGFESPDNRAGKRKNFTAQLKEGASA
jgi:hypothetical protein